MSTGRRLAKRSIIGTKVCAPGPDGLWYSGVIQDVKTPPTSTITSADANINTEDVPKETKYMVRFDFKTQDFTNGASLDARRSVSVHTSPALTLRRNAMIKEFLESDLIGPGFRSIMGIKLQPGQRVYLTYNGRETSGDVLLHDMENDEVVVKITAIGCEEPIELKKRLEEVRLLESRRSARLADQERDTDFARLADMGGDRRKTSHSIEVPLSTMPQHNSRKRPPSCAYECNGDTYDEDEMNENNAAMILLNLSHSPKSPKSGEKWPGSSPGSSSASWSSGSSSPPLSDDGHNMGANINNDSASARIRTTSVSTSDEGIVVDYKDDAPRKKRPNKSKFLCTWKGCNISEHTKAKIERHIRNKHLGIKKIRRVTDHLDSDSHDSDSHEEEFYYTEVEDDDDDCKTPSPTSPPTLSHRDMARPPHEDPEYQKRFVGNIKQGRAAAQLQQQQQQQQQYQQNIQQYNNNGKSKKHLNSNSNCPHNIYISNNNQQQMQQLQNNNTSCIPTSPLAHHNYTYPAATTTTVIATSVTNTENLNNNTTVASNFHVNHNHNHEQPQQHQPTTGTTYIKHARSSPRPSQSTAPYPSPTYVHQHHNYSSSTPINPNNSMTCMVTASAPAEATASITTIVNNHQNNNSANSVLQQLSQQNVTVTTHNNNSRYNTQQQQLQQLQQQQLATVTITPNFAHARGMSGNGHNDATHNHQQQQHQLHHQQQQQQPLHQQQQQRLQQSPTATASHRLVASNAANLNSNSINSSTVVASASAVPTNANAGHVHQQHVAVQHVNKQTPNSPNRRTRGENKKCRKVYGMDRRDMWCTQCRWKKACSRFGD